jgi:hypothetical protein
VSTDQQINAAMDHFVSTLPDSISKREAVLNFLLDFTPKKFSRRSEIKEMLVALQMHNRAQAEFCFPVPAQNPKSAGAGHNGGGK